MSSPERVHGNAKSAARAAEAGPLRHHGDLSVVVTENPPGSWQAGPNAALVVKRHTRAYGSPRAGPGLVWAARALPDRADTGLEFLVDRGPAPAAGGGKYRPQLAGIGDRVLGELAHRGPAQVRVEF